MISYEIYTGITPAACHKLNPQLGYSNEAPTVCYKHIHLENSNMLIYIMTSVPGDYEKAHAQLIENILVEYFDTEILGTILSISTEKLAVAVKNFVTSRASWFFRHTEKDISKVGYAVLILNLETGRYTGFANNSCISRYSATDKTVCNTYSCVQGNAHSRDCFAVYNSTVMDVTDKIPSVGNTIEKAMRYKDEEFFDICIESFSEREDVSSLTEANDAIITFIPVY